MSDANVVVYYLAIGLVLATAVMRYERRSKNSGATDGGILGFGIMVSLFWLVLLAMLAIAGVVVVAYNALRWLAGMPSDWACEAWDPPAGAGRPDPWEDERF